MEANTMTMNTLVLPRKSASLLDRVSKDNLVLFGLLTLITTLFALFLLFPLWSMLKKSVQNANGEFVGLANFADYLSSLGVWASLSNTLILGVSVTAIVTLAAFGFAYALTRSCMPFKGLFKVLGTAPILAPSLLPAISLVFLFGNQGIAKSLLGGQSVYGLIGISMGLIFWTFPHALMLLTTSMRTSDARLYEAAKALNTSPLKTFFIVTLPGAKYGLISTLIVIFTLVITDFGVAKVIGGSDNVLATDIFKQVVGQQNFAMGAVTSIILLFPAILAFMADRWVKKKQKSLIDTRSVVYQPAPNKVRDSVCFLYCALISAVVLVVLGMAVYGSLVTFWPWNQTLTLNNYNFAEISTYGWSPFFNSLEMAFWAAIFGTTLIFTAAYAMEKGRAFAPVRQLLQMVSILPMAVPGMVLGLGYIFYFNDAANPLNTLYGSMALLVINTIVHYYTVGHMTSLAALKQLPAEIEATAASVKMPQFKLFYKVTLPVCLPALFDIGMYLFVNALTTTSAVVFLYSTDTIPASVSVLNMDDAGQTGAAAAMAVMIMLSALSARLIQWPVAKWLGTRTQAWRNR
ncbi:putative 2-aminoethylphosphonate ABC transporter permease subunit [Enterovibrio paralichthyis]|uniref:putative 2-aminoethylphosphonate ABC transporter permease subunit n=1 Tax=Enterovibrio paralichthyis TaxID=2853805 RepID=UPI001C43FC8E|nr:putative 2-aminoethylphosphonate ABC transporter permease subunit [Enterovibrio paralichthyis]MBV7298235.1 putative 2-aminoethylphosphonate ABC transporter permease subunit [Enterovibrio paralichthyis]